MFSCAFAFAQVSITVQVPSAVSLDEQFRLSFVVEGERVSDFQWPGTDDFTVQWGPQTGTSSSTSIINGKVSKSVSTSYTYVLLPNKEGAFTIPSCSVKVKGKTVVSEPKKVTVGKARSSSSESSSRVSSEDIFLRLIVNKTDVVLGESIDATLKLYTRVPIAGFEDNNFPSFDGFWSQVTDSPSNVELHRETLGDDVFDVAVLRGYKIIPQRVGDLTIEPANMVCQVRVRNRTASSGSIFDSFFQNDYDIIRRRLSTKPVVISVHDLPQPQPKSFCGGVGKFRMTVKNLKDSLKTHDASSIIINIMGTGNLNLMEAPIVSFPADFEVYGVKTTDGDGVRTFEYPFIPRHYGKYEIGPIEFSYYDVDAKSYKTIQHPVITLNVAKVAETESSSIPNTIVNMGGKDVKNLGADIRYITLSSSSLRPSGKFFVFSILFFVFVFLIILSSVIVFLVTRKIRKDKGDIVGARKKGASKLAKKKLAVAESYLKQGLSGAFYEELHKALLGFVADKYTLEISDLDKEGILESLEKDGVPKELTDEYMSLVDACEYARYAPDNQNDQMDKHYRKALELISSLSEKSKNGFGKAAAIVALVLFLAPGLRAQDWNSACESYAAGNYLEAFEKWHKIEESGLVSPELYYNLGCASFKCSDIARSVLYFERALKLDPGYSDARHNLEFVSQFLQDRVDTVPEFFLVSWFRKIRNTFSSDVWAVLSLLMLALLASGVVVFSLSRNKKLKITSFIVAIISILGFSLSLSSAIALKNVAEDGSHAVVMSAVSAVRSSPDSKSGVDLFVLHEGTKALILEEVGNWYRIELADGRQGWTLKSDLEVI